jgi:hypothetical protein
VCVDALLTIGLLTNPCIRRVRVTAAEKDAIAQDTEEALKRKEAEAEERKKQSHDMVAESIRRELAESMSQHFCYKRPDLLTVSLRGKGRVGT